MKTFSKRLLTMLLAAAMVFSLSGMTTFAAEADEQDTQGLSAQDEITTIASDVAYQEYDLNFDWYTDPEAESYTISTAEQLAAFSAIVNGTDLPPGISQNSFADQTVNLDDDIIMNDADDVWSEDGEWGGISTPTLHISDDAYAFTPIGNMRFNLDGSRASGYSFEGTFNGNGHTIENLFVYGGADEDGYRGLFGVVGGMAGESDRGLLKDFTITGVIDCEGGEYGTEIDFVGGACAKLNAGGTIKGVINQATIYAPFTDNVGGIVGFAGTPSAMGGSDNITTNPSYEENPSGYNTFVLCCANEATVLGFHKNGGIVGENAATVKYCYNSGWIMCRRNYTKVRMGGIAGTNGNNDTAVEESVIAYCYNTGEISNNGRDDQYVAAGSGIRDYAGIAGTNFGGHGKNEVYNCYNIGVIPKGYSYYNSIVSDLDDDPGGLGCGAYVAVRNNYSLDDPDKIAISGVSDYPQETGYWVTEEEFKIDTYGDNDILTGLGPYFVADKNGKNKEPGFPILWWQDEEAELPTLTGLTIAQGPDKTTYINGDIFDPTGMVVYAEYDDGEVRAILTADVGTKDGITYDGLTGSYTFERTSLTNQPQYVEITYTDRDTTVSAWQPINGAVPSISEVNITSDMAGNTKTYDGEEVTLTADVEVDPAGAELTYQWYNGEAAIEGATEKEYTLAGNVSDSGTYKCVVTASYGGEQTDPATGEITIEITKAEQALSFAQSEMTKMLGDEPFTNELSGTAAGATVTYTSSDDAIATVDENGRVTILADGSVTITADVSETANYESATATYKLVVEKPQEPSIGDVTITSDMEDNAKTYDGKEVALTVDAEVAPAIAEVTYQWYKVAEDGTETKIDGETDSVLNLPGDVSDTGTYKCEVTAMTLAEYGSVSKDAAITITITAAAQEISFTESEITKTEGDEPFVNTLIETTVDTAGGAAITYASSDETIATVDEDGQVTILAAGEATITATVSATANYAEAAASYALTIESSPGPNADKKALEEAIADAEGLDESKYTEDSWKVMQSALDAAKAVDANPDATQDDVDAAAKALETAMDDLKPAGGGTYKNGLLKDDDGVWRLYKDNVFQENYTGFAENGYGKWYVVDGCVLFDVTDIPQDETGAIGTKGTWYYVIASKVQEDFTGLSNFSNKNGWWYIVNGKVDFSRFSVDQNKNGWWYVEGGKVRFDFTGLANHKNEYGWWYIDQGKVDFTRFSVDQNKNGWWYVTGGKVQFGYTGVANYKNQYGWWYIKEGKVDFSYNGRASNNYGTWSVAYGKVVF